MIVIIILAALCTGVLCGAASFYWLGVHEFTALMIAVGITGAGIALRAREAAKKETKTHDELHHLRTRDDL